MPLIPLPAASNPQPVGFVTGVGVGVGVTETALVGVGVGVAEIAGGGVGVAVGEMYGVGVGDTHAIVGVGVGVLYQDGCAWIAPESITRDNTPIRHTISPRVHRKRSAVR